MEVALWLKNSAKGVNYFSASFSEPYIKTDGPQYKTLDVKDDLPF
jgi:hypothetical protein